MFSEIRAAAVKENPSLRTEKIRWLLNEEYPPKKIVSRTTEKISDGSQNMVIECNGFAFQTDNQGRTICAKGWLNTANGEIPRRMPSMDEVGGGDQKPDDDMGHLIAHRFDGPDSIENLVPQNANFNRSTFKIFENSLAHAVEDGKAVYLQVEPRYMGNSNRPDSFKVLYTVDGHREIVVFRNEGR